MADKREPLSDDALLEILKKEENAARNLQSSQLSAERETALNYYDRQPYGDEQDGASSVVTSEFADVIESIMPGLMRVFTSTDDTAEFTPGAPGQEKWAKEASEYVPHVVMKENDGFTIVHALMKDALMFRLGGATVDLEEREDRREVPSVGLPQDAIDILLATAEEQGAEIELDLEPDPAPVAPLVPAVDPETGEPVPPEIPLPTFSGTITVTQKRKHVIVESIASEDILFSPAARSIDKGSFVGFRKKVTSSDLVKMGLTLEEIEGLSTEQGLTIEESQRNDGVITPSERTDDDDSEKVYWVVVAYVRADDDGDGISELLRVVYAHAGGTVGKIIERVVWETPASVVLATPILMPHTIVGRSLFDQVKDLQQINSVLTRGFLDNVYMANRPRPVVSDQVNIDSLIDWVPGSPVRLKAGAKPGEGHVEWLTVPNIGPGVLAALEYQATVKENRTGVVRNNQGLDADSLNKTAKGMGMLMSAAEQRQELIARTFAETAIKRLYRLVYLALKRSAKGPVNYWTGKAFAQCDPSKWPDDMDLSVNVGMGTGNKEQSIAHLGMVAQMQEKLLTLQGGQPVGPFVTAENVANTAQKITETLGFKSPGLFFQPAEKVGVIPPQTQQPPQNPELLVAHEQIQIMREAAEADVQIKREKARSDIQIAEFKAKQWAEIERYKAGLKANLQEQELQHETALEGARIMHGGNGGMVPQ